MPTRNDVPSSQRSVKVLQDDPLKSGALTQSLSTGIEVSNMANASIWWMNLRERLPFNDYGI